MSAVGSVCLSSKAILSPAKWEKANDGALRRHDEALRASRASALHLIRSIADSPCTCPEGLYGICPACRSRAYLGTPATPKGAPR